VQPSVPLRSVHASCSSEAALADAQPPKHATVDEREHKLLQRECEATRLQVEEMRLANVKLATEIDMLKRELEQARLQRKVSGGPSRTLPCVCLSVCRFSHRPFVPLCNAGQMKLRMRKRVESQQKRCCELLPGILTRWTCRSPTSLWQARFH
jgi:hypothetical protein